MLLKYKEGYLYTDKNNNRFAYASNVRSMIKEFVDILDEHYSDICSHILELETVRLISIIDKNYNVLYGLHKLDDNLIQKELSYIKKLKCLQRKILKTEYYDIHVYEQVLEVELESGYNLIIIVDSMKQIDVIKSLINAYL